MLDLLGPYGKQAEPELLLARRNEAHPTGLADLCGTRLAVTIETDEGRRFNESLVKWLTGGDIIKARFMRQDFFEFLPTHKLWIATNHKPVVRGTDDAIWRRLRLIPFAVTIPPGERDKRLSEKLRAELPGILAWAVRGCMEWQRCGLQEPAAVIKATAAYRQEMDLLAAFLGECCVVNPLAKVQGKALFAVYEAWCVQTGESALTYRQFNARLKERGFTNDKGTKGWFVWHGIGLSEHARVEQLNSTPPPQKWSNSTQVKQASEAGWGSGVEQGGVVSPITALNRGGSRGNRENCSTHSTYSTPALAEVAAAKDADGEEAGEL
mgnify:CR=1 FL=1